MSLHSYDYIVSCNIFFLSPEFYFRHFFVAFSFSFLILFYLFICFSFPFCVQSHYAFLFPSLSVYRHVLSIEFPVKFLTFSRRFSFTHFPFSFDFFSCSSASSFFFAAILLLSTSFSCSFLLLPSLLYHHLLLLFRLLLRRHIIIIFFLFFFFPPSCTAFFFSFFAFFSSWAAAFRVAFIFFFSSFIFLLIIHHFINFEIHLSFLKTRISGTKINKIIDNDNLYNFFFNWNFGNLLIGHNMIPDQQQKKKTAFWRKINLAC